MKNLEKVFNNNKHPEYFGKNMKKWKSEANVNE
jgi:hypothetical protein